MPCLRRRLQTAFASARFPPLASPALAPSECAMTSRAPFLSSYEACVALQVMMCLFVSQALGRPRRHDAAPDHETWCILGLLDSISPRLHLPRSSLFGRLLADEAEPASPRPCGVSVAARQYA
ncbi:hypothetical protein NDU88_000275 [Pleurodeles waltl]|uniref:Uncharacterized protein n=1 Tax=Pleurodeles waltl TaxID=8319 RepID=A0AAV7S923_PLEWA|nr:hypothetical protein NDU88_000275 [Pleurodeles waltl]